MGGCRQYPPEVVATVKVVKAVQRLGFTLDEISELLGVGAHRSRHRLSHRIRRPRGRGRAHARTRG